MPHEAALETYAICTIPRCTMQHGNRIFASHLHAFTDSHVISARSLDAPRDIDNKNEKFQGNDAVESALTKLKQQRLETKREYSKLRMSILRWPFLLQLRCSHLTSPSLPL
jgi:hypothetical protein